MCKKIILCPDKILELILGPDWDGNTRNLDKHILYYERLKDLIDLGEFTIYLPPSIYAIIQSTLEDSYQDPERIRQEKQKLLAIVTTDLEVSQDQIFQESTDLNLPKEANYYEEIILISAMKISADAIVASPSTVQLLHQIRSLNEKYFVNFNIPVLNLDSFLLFHSNSPMFEYNDKFIYVRTPGNNFIKLLKGSTPIDFAYKIHTKVGNACTGVLVNNLSHPLDKPLHYGDVVEIIKGKSGDILTSIGITDNSECDLSKFCQTNTAKKQIKRCLRVKNQKEGWKIINENLKKKERKIMPKILNQVSCQSEDELALKIGQGKINIEEIKKKISLFSNQKQEEKCIISPKNNLLKGNGHRNYEIATCCCPTPKQPIIGISSSLNRPLKVHHKNCSNIQELITQKSDHLIELDWNCDQAKVQLQLRLTNEPNTLIPILKKLENDYKIEQNIHSVMPQKNGYSWSLIEINLKSEHNLDTIISDIKNMPKVQEAKVKQIKLFNKCSSK